MNLGLERLLLVAQELSQWRQQQLQESLRNSVLDEEAAAKFSTAAALAAKEKRNQMAKANYDKGLLTAVDTVDAFAQVAACRSGPVIPCDMSPLTWPLLHGPLGIAPFTLPSLHAPLSHAPFTLPPSHCPLHIAPFACPPFTCPP